MKKASVTAEGQQQIPKFRTGTKNENFGLTSKAFIRMLKANFGVIVDDMVADRDFQAPAIDPLSVRRYATMAGLSAEVRADMQAQFATENVPEAPANGETAAIRTRRAELLEEFKQRQQEIYDDEREKKGQEREWGINRVFFY